MKSIIKSILTITAVLVLSVGVTSAYFTDQKSGSPNIFSTGTVTVMIGPHVVTGGSEFVPGSEYEIEFYVTNIGTLPVEVKGYFSGEWSNQELDPGAISFNDFEALVEGNWMPIASSLQPNEEIEFSDSYTGSNVLEQDEMKPYRVKMKLAETAGNEYQYETFTSNIHIAAKQIADGADWPAEY